MMDTRKIVQGTVGLAVGLVLATAGVAAAKGKDAKPGKDAKMDPVMRGMYIVSTSGCNDCHTPWVFNKDIGMPMPDMSRMLSGHAASAPEPAAKVDPKTDLAFIGADFTAFKLPFGTVYSANLTPDKETGLGTWTEEMFIKAMRTGMHLGADSGRPILPPMPWPDFRNFTDDDLKAIFAFLKTVPPVHNPVPDPKVPPPVIEGLTKTHPKLIEILDAAHAHHGAPPAGAAPEKAAAPTKAAAPAEKK
jgi:hypothetical protein